MVRDENPEAITLAIGDGANDVNMICQAHVGVGIQGLEGMQAARSSDYAISQFKYMRSLLFFHGREAYRRNSILAIYMFYKNILFVMPQFWFGFWSAFTGQTLYEAIIYQAYNIVFTAFPIMIFAIFDQEQKRRHFISDPKHYWVGLHDEYYSLPLLTFVVIKGILNGLLILVFSFFTLNGLNIGPDQHTDSFWMTGTLCYGLVVINANAFVCQQTSTHTRMSLVWLSLSILSWFFIFWLENTQPWSQPIYRSFGETFSDGRVWLVIFLCLW